MPLTAAGTGTRWRWRAGCTRPTGGQREPYANHLLRVTIRILSHYRVSDPDVACAALLHDAVEDHAADLAPGGGRQGALAVLAGRFGGRTAALVAAVTKPRLGVRPRRTRAVPRARPGQLVCQPVGTGDQGVRLQ